MKRVLTPRKVVSPIKWRKYRSKSKDKKGKKDGKVKNGKLSRRTSESVRDVKGHVSSSSQKRDFMEKRPSLRDISSHTLSTKSSTKRYPGISKLPIERIKGSREYFEEMKEWVITESKKDIIERRIPLSTDFTDFTDFSDDEDWPSTDSISDFSHLKEVLDNRLKQVSPIGIELNKDRIQEDYLEYNPKPPPPSDCGELEEDIICRYSEQVDPESETRGLERFLKISTLNMPQPDKRNMQMSIWRIPSEELHHITLKDLHKYSYVVIHSHQAAYTYIQTMKQISYD